jgi:hypothetical protein
MVPEESYFSVNRYRCKRCGVWAYRLFTREHYGSTLKLGPLKVYAKYSPKSQTTRREREDPQMFHFDPYSRVTARKGSAAQ